MWAVRLDGKSTAEVCLLHVHSSGGEENLGRRRGGSEEGLTGDGEDREQGQTTAVRKGSRMVAAASPGVVGADTLSLRVLRRCSGQLELTGGLGEGAVLRGG